ncbi:MAG: hypothetical protein IT306_25425 [Chloroflexi bacterium]|nr:hypothetical protein [Chloroflexota bacterium]
MLDMAWWLGFDSGADPRETVVKLQKAVSNYRKYVLATILFIAALGALISWGEGPRGWWFFINVGGFWSLAALLTMLPSAIVERERWALLTRRIVVVFIWITTMWLAAFGAWAFMVYETAGRTQDALGWQRTSLVVAGLLLAGLNWSTLAGVYLRKHGRCTCPPPIKRWMQTAPVPRNVDAPHRCPARTTVKLAA